MSEQPVTMRRPAPAAGPAIASLPGAHSTLHVVGTPSPSWQFLSRAWPAVLQGADGPVPVRVVDDAATLPWESAVTTGYVMVFVDRPARALCQLNAAGSDPTGPLARWREAAHQALQAAHRWPGRCVLVDAEAAMALPKGLDAAIARWGIDSAGLIRGEAPPVADAVEAVLTERIAAADARCTALAEEVLASCVPLVDSTAVDQGAADPMVALSQHHALKVAISEVQDRLAQRLDVEAELEREIERVREAERAREVDRVREAELARAAELAREDARAREAAAAQARDAQAMQERDLLARQIGQLEHELKRLHLRGKEVERAGRIGGSSMGVQAGAGNLRLLHANEALPHRHLHFELQHISVAGRQVPKLEFRLLEHHGRAGLALFSGGGSVPEPVFAWAPSGQEGGRPFMLIVPSDEAGAALLQRFGTADWSFVNTLARAVRLDLESGALKLPAHWKAIAARLTRRLDTLPQRLRYDVTTVRRHGDDPASLDIDFGRALYGEQPLGTLRLRWRPARRVGQARLQWLAPPSATDLPLAAWPAGEGTAFAAAFVFPVGADFQRGRWAALSPYERGLLLAVLDALPGAAQMVPAPDLPGGLSNQELVRCAAALHRAARRVAKDSWWRRAVVRLRARRAGRTA